MIELVLSLAELPTGIVDVPVGYTLRSGTPDEWRSIHDSTGEYGTVDPALFRREFGDGDPDRILFLDHEGRAMGVSAAWHPQSHVHPSRGRVHWVAVRPEVERQGLGRFLVLATLRRRRELGHTSAYLTTGSENHRAVALYRSLGFVLSGMRTKRLRLRRPASRDVPGFGELLSDAATFPYITESGPVAPADVADWVAQRVERYWVIEESGEFVGFVAVHGDCDLSFAVRRARRRKGIANEAIQAVAEIHPRLVARTHTGNEASIALLLAIGFEEHPFDGPRREFRLG